MCHEEKYGKLIYRFIVTIIQDSDGIGGINQCRYGTGISTMMPPTDKAL